MPLSEVYGYENVTFVYPRLYDGSYIFNKYFFVVSRFTPHIPGQVEGTWDPSVTTLPIKALRAESQNSTQQSLTDNFIIQVDSRVLSQFLCNYFFIYNQSPAVEYESTSDD